MWIELWRTKIAYRAFVTSEGRSASRTPASESVIRHPHKLHTTRTACTMEGATAVG